MSGRKRPSMQGTRNHNSRLTPELVRQIRLRSRMGETRMRISTEMGISTDCVGDVLRGDTWAWLPDLP